jgi:hypothetical protein
MGVMSFAKRQYSWHAESWGSLQGVDMALMIEVVEHLDPDVLE